MIHLHKIASWICDWEMIATDFGINDQQVEAITRDNPQRTGLQKREMLRLWMQKLGKDATYSKLIDIFKSDDNGDMVDRIKDLVLQEQGCYTVISSLHRTYLMTMH